MTTLFEQANEYFASINPLASRIADDIDYVIGLNEEEWLNLTPDEQDAKLDSYFIENPNRNLDVEDLPECFPKLKINCGEKIVVDFDNDGWTWRDEHSGPFSWMSRSQQDLVTLDADDEGLGEDVPSKPKVPPRPPRKSRTPKNNGVKIGLEKSIWESPFLAADRGLDSGYPSSHTSESKSSEDSEKISLSIVEENIFGDREQEKLLDSSFESNDTQIWVGKSTDNAEESQNKSSSSPVDMTSPDLHDEDESIHLASRNSLLEEIHIQPAVEYSDELGQISPVFISDNGETSTDPEPITVQPTSRDLMGGEVNLALDESADSQGLDLDNWNLPSFSTKTENEKSATLKSGFDFLDDW